MILAVLGAVLVATGVAVLVAHEVHLARQRRAASDRMRRRHLERWP